MRFFDPTNTYAEKNCVKNHKKELLALGSRAVSYTHLDVYKRQELSRSL